MDGLGSLVLPVWLGVCLVLLAVDLLGLRRRRLGPPGPWQEERLLAVDRTLRVVRGALLVLLAVGAVLAMLDVPIRLGG